MVQRNFVTGILYVNLNVDRSSIAEQNIFGSWSRCTQKQGSIFAELSESINLEAWQQVGHLVVQQCS